MLASFGFITDLMQGTSSFRVPHHPVRLRMALKVEDKLEEVHEELLTWANSIGVEIDRIRPMRISGRGFGGKSIA